MARNVTEDSSSAISTNTPAVSEAGSTAGWLLRPITALVRALSLLNPVLVLDFLSRAIDHVAAVVHPRGDKRRKLLAWLRDTLPEARTRDLQSLSNVWNDGSLLCSLVHTVVPGCSPARNIACSTFQHGQLLVCKYLGVPPAFSEEDSRQHSLTASLERRLVRYLSAVRQAAVPLLAANAPMRQRAHSSTPLAVARGMGLLMAVQGRRAVFYLYPLDREEADHFVVQIQGPAGDFGSALIPARATVRRNREQRRGSFILKPWFSTTRNSNIPIEWKVNPGSICVSYVPQNPGKHELCVTRRGCHLPGSPYNVTVERSTSQDAREDEQWLSEEELHKRREFKKKLKVVLRIVDFVTEKMVLTEDGKLTKLAPHHSLGMRTLSMPDLFSRLQSTSPQGERRTHDDIQLRDKSPSKKTISETNEEYKPKETDSVTSGLQQDKVNPSKETTHPEQNSTKESGTQYCSNLQATETAVENKSKNFRDKRKPLMKDLRSTLKQDKDNFGRKIKNVVSLCNYLVHNTPRQRSLEILNAAGCILDGRPIRLSKDMDILLMTALGRQIPIGSDRTKLLQNEISENPGVTEESTDTTRTKKGNRKVSFMIPDRSESPGQDSNSTLSCGHKREKLPSYLRDTGQNSRSQKCMKCVRTELSGLNIISQLSEQSFDEPNSPDETQILVPDINSSATSDSNEFANPSHESTTHQASCQQNEETKRSCSEDIAAKVEQTSNQFDIDHIIPIVTEINPTNTVLSDLESTSIESVTTINITTDKADLLANDKALLELETTSSNNSENSRINIPEDEVIPTEENTSLNIDLTTPSQYLNLQKSSTVDKEPAKNFKECKIHSEISNNPKGLEQILEYSTTSLETDETITKTLEPIPERRVSQLINIYNSSNFSEHKSVSAPFHNKSNNNNSESSKDSFERSSIPSKSEVNVSTSPEENSECSSSHTKGIDDLAESSILVLEHHINQQDPSSKEQQNANCFPLQSTSNDTSDEPSRLNLESSKSPLKNTDAISNPSEQISECSSSQSGKESSGISLECSSTQSISEDKQAKFPQEKSKCAATPSKSSVEDTKSSNQNLEYKAVNKNDSPKSSEQSLKHSKVKPNTSDNGSSSSEPIPGCSKTQSKSEDSSSLRVEQKPHCSKNQSNFVDLEELLRDSPEPLSDFSLWSSDVAFGSQADETKGYSSVVNFDSILSAPNLEEALKIFEEDIQRAQEESRSNTNTEDASPVNAQQEGERDRSDSDYISMEDARSSQEHSPENQQNRENMLVDVNEWMRDRGQLGPAEREIWGMMEDCEPSRFYPRVLSPGIPDLECITEEGEESPNEADSQQNNRKKRSPPNLHSRQMGSSPNNRSQRIENTNLTNNNSIKSQAKAENDSVPIGDLLGECFVSVDMVDSNETTLKMSNQKSVTVENLHDFAASSSTSENIYEFQNSESLKDESDETANVNQDLDQDKTGTAARDSNNSTNVRSDKSKIDQDSSQVCHSSLSQNEITATAPNTESPSYMHTNVPIIIVEDTDRIASDDNSSCDGLSDPELIAEEFNTLAGLTERSNDSPKDGDSENLNEHDQISVYGAPVKMRVTHWKHYWDGKMAEQKRKEDGKMSGLQKTIKKFTSQYLKSCSSKPVKRRSPTIRIPGIVNKWRKTFEDPIITEQDNHPIVRVNQIAKQWNKFFENETKQEIVTSDEEVCNITSHSEDITENCEKNIESENKLQEMKKPEFTIRELSPEPVITTSHVSKRKTRFEKEAAKQTATEKVSPMPTTNRVAKCKQFWDSLSKAESTDSSRSLKISHIPEEAVIQESTPNPEDEMWYRARRISINTDGEFSSGVSTPVIRPEEESNRLREVSSSLNNEILENREKSALPQKADGKPDSGGTRSRFESAKLFFQILEKTTSTPSRVPLLPSRGSYMNYASSTDFDDTESECGEEGDRRQRRKRRLKVSSEPTSDTETLSRLSGLRRRGTAALVGGSERLPRRKVSERFHVRDLFKDVVGDTESGFKGIPHREAVLAALRSVDNSRPVSPYEEQEPPSSPGPQSYHTEYPHLPDTPACQFKPRDMLQHGAFMTRRDIINMQ